jgi:hypothetical protein
MSRDATIGTVYLLHFDRPLAHARHYLGWAVDFHDRVDAHLAGNGARIVAAAVRAGIHVELVRTWDGVDRAFERRLKDGGSHLRLCPICRPEYNRRARDKMRAYRALAKWRAQREELRDGLA